MTCQHLSTTNGFFDLLEVKAFFFKFSFLKNFLFYIGV